MPIWEPAEEKIPKLKWHHAALPKNKYSKDTSTMMGCWTCIPIHHDGPNTCPSLLGNIYRESDWSSNAASQPVFVAFFLKQKLKNIY